MLLKVQTGRAQWAAVGFERCHGLRDRLRMKSDPVWRCRFQEGRSSQEEEVVMVGRWLCQR